jgi:hypothetical protein
LHHHLHEIHVVALAADLAIPQYEDIPDRNLNGPAGWGDRCSFPLLCAPGRHFCRGDGSVHMDAVDRQDGVRKRSECWFAEAAMVV